MKAALAATLIALAGCGTSSLPSSALTAAENALDMQCTDRKGTLAMAHGPHGEWVSCYKGKKKLWSVKL